MTKKLQYADDCNVGYAMSIIGGKWKIAIIWKLTEGSLRYGQLRAKLSSISEGVLINQLKELQADGIITRNDHKTVPPHVEYRLTPQGKKLEQALRRIEQWGAEMKYPYYHK